MTNVKFFDWPLADKNHPWDVFPAIARVRKNTESFDVPNPQTYKICFVWFNAEKADIFASYKLLIVDFIEGKRFAIPQAIIESAQVLHNSPRQTGIPEKDWPAARVHLGMYFKRMGLSPPWETVVQGGE